LEKIEEEFKLIEEYEWYEVEEVIFLVIDCVGNGILGFTASIEPYFAFYVHICFAAASAADPSA
jgi:hypothetical protein